MDHFSSFKISTFCYIIFGNVQQIPEKRLNTTVMEKAEQQFFNDLEKKLWSAADKLRSNLDAVVYKHLVLELIFLKYVSDSLNLSLYVTRAVQKKINQINLTPIPFLLVFEELYNFVSPILEESFNKFFKNEQGYKKLSRLKDKLLPMLIAEEVEV